MGQRAGQMTSPDDAYLSAEGASMQNMGDQSGRQREPDEIREDIARTRASMEETLNVLQHRLSPAHIKAQVRDSAATKVEELKYNAENSVKGVSNDVFDTIKQNPIPSALVGIGLAWLFMERRNKSDFDRGYRPQYTRRQRFEQGIGEQEYWPEERYGYGGRMYDAGQPYDASWREREGRMQQGMEGARARVSETAGNIGSKVSETAENVGSKVSETASNVGSKVSETAENVQNKAANVADQARETVEHVAGQAQWRAERAKSGFERMVQEQPLVVGAAAMAIGAAIGLSLPTTQKERELMGEARDSVMEKVQEKAQETMEKVQHVAKEAGEAAKDTAKAEAQKQNIGG